MGEIFVAIIVAGVGIFVGAKRLSLGDSLKIFAALLAILIIWAFATYQPSFGVSESTKFRVPIMAAFTVSTVYWLAKWITDVIVKNNK